MSGEERKAAILKAVRHLFAAKGFAGTTTRELAATAGVSEALLYRHFPTKEALYGAIHESICSERKYDKFDQLAALEPSTVTLVLLVHYMVSILARDAADPGEGSIPHRLILRSLAEDGEYARILSRRLAEFWSPKVVECLKAAAAVGDAIEERVPFECGSQFAFHLARMVVVQFLPPTPVGGCGPLNPELVSRVVWFVLRGMGLKEEVIRRYYQPETLAALGL
ncbi:Transcriptional regulator, TetR family [Fimbriiglobus ruber]|uniref:Transcriptional regulator, TetR family n=1 Tax=Fimbriiglobus ruber TaxID=1908690 RepID=A0A225E4I1_9BACT|nr:Transcriptional regulator, TetR family [Fimbriiglobus ruber]